ncbi:unnamed protein product [Cylindrotheca closterium]|uniref:Uncharacterized protein n=1 Tax=Cylindrotheca closterium TaxID=2856 RepID=A0AAD2CHE6_9STRA|nr:unnamed protein product [Cylindrotheca closterium]
MTQHNQSTRGDRGGNRFGGNRQTSGNSQNAKKKEKRSPMYHPSDPDFPYADVTRSLIEQIGMEGLEYPQIMISSIKELNEPDWDGLKPKLDLTGQEDKIEREAKKEELKTESVKYHRQKRYWSKAKWHVHLLIMESFVTSKMKDKILQEVDYNEKIKGDPIELLRRINKFITTSDVTDWEPITLWEALQKWVNCRQKGNETVIEYHKRFEECATTVLSFMGDSWLEVFTAKTTAYHEIENNHPTNGLSDREKKRVAAEVEELQAEFQDKFVKLFCAAGLLHNCDRARYQPVLDHFVTAYAVEHVDYAQRDLFPRDVETAAKALHNHWVKKTTTPKHNNNNNNNNTNDKTNTPQNGTNLAQDFNKGSKRKWFCCGKADHVAPRCEHRFLPKEQWKDPTKWRSYPRTKTGRDQVHLQTGTEEGSVQSSVTANTAGTPANNDGGISQQNHMQTGSADRSGGPQPQKQKIGIQGWNMAQFGGRKRVPQPILRPSRFGTSPPHDIMANWQVQLDAVRAAEEEVQG